ncbi:MAG: YaaR family protein [Clostridia bacterium]|nr:YaaR family protein [Clostridia bacterium]
MGIKIQDKNKSKNIQLRSEANNNIEKTSTKHQEFQDIFSKQNSVFKREDLEIFLNELDKIGNKLVKSFSVYDLITYKNLLRNFLNGVQKEVYGIKEESGWTRTGQHKLYQRIEVLNQEMEKLTSMVLNKQKDNVKILKKLDTIRGLVIDLYF